MPARPAILLTGYWPPSNEAVRQWSNNPAQNPGGWVGSNWEARGYDVYSFFPEFSNPSCTSCGAGMGDLMVDYQDSSTDFWAIANAVKPIAIITFSRTGASTSWELEMNQYNRTTWGNDYIAPTQPTPSPPDASVPAGTLRLSALPVNNIVTDVVASGLPVNCFICFANHAGGFVSEFIAYHGVWYQDIHKSPADPNWCIAAGHVHVGSGLSWTVARQAAEVTLRTVINHVDGVRAGMVCQTNLGFQGPGSSHLSVCGGPLNLATNAADVLLTGGTPGALGVLAFGAQFTPLPLFGGTVVPLPAFYGQLMLLDGQGSWFWDDGLTGVVGGLPQIYAQAAYLDPAQIEENLFPIHAFSQRNRPCHIFYF
jgi:pyrrolidone-carboxylate peptidase